MHLFEFESSGFYAAADRESAFQAVMKNLGYDRKDTEDDFVRDVPDDELIEAISEDSWEHPDEVWKHEPDYGRTVYRLSLTAAKHAALAPEWGYCFGGEQ